MKPIRTSPTYSLWPLLFLAVLLFATACTEPDLVILSSTTDQDDSFGVGLLERTWRVRVDETVSTEVYLPLGAEDQPLNEAAPVVVSLQGGLVSPGQYQWLNAHMASRGALVIAPRHDLDLAIFEQGNTLDILQALRQASEREDDLLYERVLDAPAMVIGHSLGGVVAARAWLDAPQEISHLVLLASEPNPADDVETRTDSDGFVLSIAGSQDGRIDPDEVAAGAAKFSVPTIVAVVEGMNHFQLVDAVTSAQWESDTPATRSTLDARRLVLDMVDEALLNLSTGDDAFFDDPSRWPEGVTPYE